MEQNSFLEAKADFIRKDLIRVAVKSGAGHIAPSLSCVDILVALYYRAMNYTNDPLWEERDRLILSKAHGGYGLYAILADKGVIPKDEWENFHTQQSSLTGCVSRNINYGLEAGCGSLGHGLPMAVGVAFGAKLLQKAYHTYCIIGDGELQEGTMWEAIQFAVKHELNNLTIIVDNNRLQALDFLKNILDRSEDDLQRKLEGFGLNVSVCPGHDVVTLAELLNKLKDHTGDRVDVVLAQTVKGFGLKCMENMPKFHYRLPSVEELAMG